MGRLVGSIAELGPGLRDGDVAWLRVSQDTDTLVLQLFWDFPNSRWVSEPVYAPTMGSDLDWISPLAGPVLGWSYLGTANSLPAWWALRAGSIQCAGAFFAAGMKLQDRISGRFSNRELMVSPWWYEYDDAQVLVFDNDQGPQFGKTWNGVTDIGFMPSTLNLGHGAVLDTGVGPSVGEYISSASYGDALGGYAGLTRSPSGWDDVKFFVASTPSGAALGGVPTTTPTVPTKRYLYPTFYGNSTGSFSGEVAAVNYDVRWVSA